MTPVVRRRRKSRTAKILLGELFRWQSDDPQQLAQRVNALRELALRRIFTNSEWKAYEQACAQMRTNIKQTEGGGYRE
jgi:hypothetical protein